MMLCLENMVIQAYDNMYACAQGTRQPEAPPVVEVSLTMTPCAGCKRAAATGRRAEAFPFSCAEAACH